VSGQLNASSSFLVALLTNGPFFLITNVYCMNINSSIFI